MAGIEEEIKELVGRDDTNAVGVYSTLRLITVEDNEESGTASTIEADSGTIHVINEVKDSDDGAEINLPDPPKAPSSLITVKAGNGLDQTLPLNADDASIFGTSTVPAGNNSLVELVSDGENYHTINVIDNSGA
mgnify:FL=1